MDDTSLAFREATGAALPRRATPGEAFALARDWVRAGRHLDMAALAAELGIGRATLYRWTGDRGRLLADIVRSDLDLLFAHSIAGVRGGGAARLERLTGAFLDAVAERSSVRSLLANEGEAGLRMLTAPDGPIRPHLVRRATEVIEAEAAAGRYRPPADPAVLADGIISLGERFLHNGGDPTLNPDPATAKAVVRLLLREDPPA